MQLDTLLLLMFQGRARVVLFDWYEYSYTYEDIVIKMHTVATTELGLEYFLSKKVGIQPEN